MNDKKLLPNIDNFRLRYDAADVKIKLNDGEINSLFVEIAIYFSMNPISSVVFIDKAERLLRIGEYLEKKWRQAYRSIKKEALITLKYADAVVLWEFLIEKDYFTKSPIDCAFLDGRGKLDQALKSNNLFIEAFRLKEVS